ncbi:RNA degradosome polyphosphate kinase [Anaerolentibacter hominis]|uniref:RNA degradosome polyphosphate kinase n=1 Tax=Anaerolentibacter hominis TaxID=3079009 RepID=UPI0031B8501C
MAQKIDFQAPENFWNRELSWIEFNSRVLSEARDKAIPLLERLKFLSITASNLDEFFMIRVASLRDMVNADYTKRDIAGLTPMEQLEQINIKTHEFVASQYSTYNRSFLPQLKLQNIHAVSHFEDLTPEQSEFVDRYFQDTVYPVLTPMAVDSSRPFPLIRNKTLNIGALIQDIKSDREYEFATVQVPAVLPRIVPLPNADGEEGFTFILLEQLIEKNIQKLFLNYKVICAYPYRIMRNADLTIDEEEAADLLMEIEKQLKKRQWGEVIRLEVEEGINKQLLKILRRELGVKESDVFKINGPLDLTFLMKLHGLKGFSHLREKAFLPQPVMALETRDGEDIFAKIRQGDILLHHPYQTFDPVVDFVRQAARDKDVLAIKQTLYRVSSNSPIIASLAQAAENGKQVTVLVELKARFDEENNILWARKLEQAGCHVIYGLLGLKTHSKITLVVRKEDDGIRRYVHLGTGNYNDSTAKLYTDTGLLTCSVPIGEDATAVFNMLSGYSEPASWRRLAIAPLWLRDRFLSLIRREAENARAGKPARIIAKMNSLCDPIIISALYEASHAGVSISLIIRGICCLKTGIPQISETITVHSIVGTFLEHARIFYFENNGSSEIYMGSADWMPRNLDKRVEILFPIEDEHLKKQVMEILTVQLADNVKAQILQPDGSYEKIDKRGKVLVNSQDYFCQKAIHENKLRKELEEDEAVHIFVPLTHESIDMVDDVD